MRVNASRDHLLLTIQSLSSRKQTLLPRTVRSLETLYAIDHYPKEPHNYENSLCFVHTLDSVL
jgi:hypothetical protein